MNTPKLPNVKIYHIVHVDRLASIIADGNLWCDAVASRRFLPGTTIGMSKIKHRRRTTALSSYPNLCVGDCVPFYFCPRSVMLYTIHKQNHPDLAFRGGQSFIIHLQADLMLTVDLANTNKQRWVFTSSNASSRYFIDYDDLAKLNQIDWNAVNAPVWPNCKERKQAEFLVEHEFSWNLISYIGVHSLPTYNLVATALHNAAHKPPVYIETGWYY